MQLEIQSIKGHSVITEAEMSDEEMRVRFYELIRHGYSAFADTKIDNPDGPYRTWDAVTSKPGIKSIYMVGPQVGG